MNIILIDNNTMNKPEDLIIIINENIRLTKEFVGKLIAGDHLEEMYKIESFNIKSIDIVHNVLNYSRFYTFGPNNHIYYSRLNKCLFISHASKKGTLLYITINLDLSYIHIKNSKMPKNTYISIEIEDRHVLADIKGCMLHNALNNTTQFVYINNNRFEMYEIKKPFEMCYKSNRVIIKHFINEINKAKNSSDPKIDYIHRIEYNNQHKKSNRPHEHICISLIHKFDTYPLRDCNPIKHIIDFLYPYRY